MNKVVVFQVQNEQYAIPVEHVISIEKMDAPTLIPNMPDYMVGVVRIREELTPVLDTTRILYNRPFTPTDRTRLVVVMADGLSVAFIVDDAKEIIDIPEKAIKQVNMLAYRQTTYFIGIANLPERLITIIDPKKWFASLEGSDAIKQHVQKMEGSNHNT